jgi:hypothetical protein
VGAAGSSSPRPETVEFITHAPGIPKCDVSKWPGRVLSSTFRLIGASIEASWANSCNQADLAQTYSIQAGDLDLLQATGSYTHAPLGGSCNRVSPSVFTPGAGNEYYLIVPNAVGREGGLGAHSNGEPRPHLDGTCGEPREAVCP